MLLIYTFLFAQLIFSSQSLQYLSLDGNDWVATNQNGSIQIGAKVPGSIYSDLINNKVISNPYYRFNDLLYRWVANDNWTFVKTFSVDESLLQRKSVNLVFDGVDTVSKIYVNDVLVGATDNMFVRYIFDVKKFLKTKENKIKVVFESPISYAYRKEAEHVKTRGYTVPPACPPKEQQGICHSNFIRKMQASFSWDWGPGFPTQGIWKHVYIEGLDTALIRDVSVETLFNKTWSIKTKVHVETTLTNSFKGQLNYFLDGKLLFTEELALVPTNGTVQVVKEIKVNETFEIKSWWPNGVGFNQQNLYSFQVILTLNASEKIQSKIYKIGFRTIELIQNPVQPKGLTFYFSVNGLSFFAKGSNWIPAHVFYEQLDKKYIRSLLKSAKDANMNMLRVWGGGIYETDYFYQVADEFGIMIWQDMMFACALYPDDQNFIKSVSLEIQHNIRRLQHHPSIVLWAGNNENELAISTPWFPQVLLRQKVYRAEYVDLYINVIQKIILSEDNSRPYISSSPSNGLESVQEHWIAKNPQDSLYGDTHYYNYASTPLDWTIYPRSRFGSEYGFQSYPSLQTLASVTESSDLVYPFNKSSLMEHRQHHPGGTQQIQSMIESYFNLPDAGGVSSFADYVYLSQIIQAMAMKTETESYRRDKFIDPKTGEGFTMGALYWQLNDIWQAPTWASVEFGGKWKMLHYYILKTFANLLVSPYEDRGILKISIVRDDALKQVDFALKIFVYKWSSLSPAAIEMTDVTTSSSSFSSFSSASLVYHQNISHLTELAKCKSRFECFIFVEITNTKLNLSANNFMFLEPALKKASGLSKPNLKAIQVTKESDSKESVFKIKLQTDKIAPFVWLDFNYQSNITGTFSDNGFLLFNENQEITFKTESQLTVNDIKSNLIVKSIF